MQDAIKLVSLVWLRWAAVFIWGFLSESKKNHTQQTQKHNFCLSINSQEIMTTRYEMSKLEWSEIFPALCWYGGRTRQLTAAGFTPGFAFRWWRRCAIEFSGGASRRVAWWSRPQCGGGRGVTSAHYSICSKDCIGGKTVCSQFPLIELFLWAFLSKENVSF